MRIFKFLLVLIFILFLAACGDLSNEDDITTINQNTEDDMDNTFSSDETNDTIVYDVELLTANAEALFKLGNYAAARILINKALISKPSHTKANFLNALLNILFIVEDETLGTIIQKTPKIQDMVAFTFSVKKGLPDINILANPYSYYQIDDKFDYYLDNKVSNNIIEINNIYPTMSDIEELLDTTIINALERSIKSLEIVTADTYFAYSISSFFDDRVFDMINTVWKMYLTSYEMNYVDFSLLNSSLYSLKASLEFLLGYEWEFGQLSDIRDKINNSNENVLYDYLYNYNNQSIFTIKNTNYFAEAKSSYSKSLQCITNALTYYQNYRTNPVNTQMDKWSGQLTRLIFGRRWWYTDADKVSDAEIDFYVSLAKEISIDLKDSINNNTLFTLSKYDFDYDSNKTGLESISQSDLQKYQVKLSVLFDDPITRNNLPKLQYNSSTGYMDVIDADPNTTGNQIISDYTFNGLLPYLTKDDYSSLENQYF